MAEKASVLLPLLLLYASCFTLVSSLDIPPLVDIATFVPYYYYTVPITQWPYLMALAVENVNNDPTILPNTTLKITNFEYYSIPATATANVIRAADLGYEISFCCGSTSATTLAGIATGTLGFVNLAPLASATELSDRAKYPLFSRTLADDINESDAILDILNYLATESGLPQYLEVGVLGTTSQYSISSSSNFIRKSPGRGVTVKTYQSFLLNSIDFEVELTELKNCGARVFIAILEPTDMSNLLTYIGNYSLVGETYVWIASSGCAYRTVLGRTSNDPVKEANIYGVIGVSLPAANTSSSRYQQLEDQWLQLDPAFLLSAGNAPNIFACLLYDGFYFMATSIHNMIMEDGFTVEGRLKNKTRFWETINNTTMNGITGWISLDPLGNRLAYYDIVNFVRGDYDYSNIGYYNYSTGLTLTAPIHFYNGSTEIPDIDIRSPFYYWSCEDKEKKLDPTGKTINVKAPGADNPSNIDIDYYCDTFIDCENLSDESVDCASNYTVLFIVFGVVAIVLVLLAILFLFFTILFGMILPRRRVRSASPFFLLITIISCIVGYISIFTWYGKPQKIACGFQPWLLGLSILSMVSSLCAKNFRIWRIFQSPFDRKVISDLELFVFWFLLLIPGLIILIVWTIVATPDAVLREVQGMKHLGCEAAGFTGPAGGIAFFFIFIGYCGILLVFSGFLSIVTRNVPSLFNESKLIAYSIYNLVFLSIVVIPVVIVLNGINPFASWIIRTVSILYAFTATLWLQFIPKIFGVVVVDKFKPAQIQNVKTMNTLTNSDTSSFSRIKEAEEDNL